MRTSSLQAWLFATTLSPAFAAAPVEPEMVSGWRSSDGNSVIIFRYDGIYHQIQDSATDPGFERGTFAWDKSTGTFTATATKDTNGTAGLSHPGGGTVTVSISSNTLTRTVPGQGTTTYSRIVNSGTPTHQAIVGSWIIPGAPFSITFLPDGNYFMADESDDDSFSSYDGMERGTYVWNATTKILTATEATDTNGDIGLSDLPATFTVNITGDDLVYDDGEETGSMRRVTTSATPLALPDYNFSKYASHTQTADAAPAPIVYDGADGDYPFEYEAEIPSELAANAPTLKIGTGAVRPFDEDEDDDTAFELGADFTTLAALNTAVPVGTAILFADGAGSATMNFSTNTFPNAPKLLAGDDDTWTAGTYSWEEAEVLHWTPVTGFDPAVHVTYLSVEDRQTGDNVVEQLIQGTMTYYDLSGKLLPGREYEIELVHVRKAGTGTAASGIFAGKNGYALLESQNLIPARAKAAQPADPPVIHLQPLSLNAVIGQDVIFTVNAEAATFQWYKNNIAIPGQTGKSLALFNIDAADLASYTVRATRGGQTITSSTAILSLGTPAPIEEIVLGKIAGYIQTGADTVILIPQPFVGYDGGPYGFEAEVKGENIGGIVTPTITPPAPTEEHFFTHLFFDEEDGEWSYGDSIEDPEFETMAGMNLQFPSGTYTFTVNGTSVPLTLTGDTYPNTPKVTLGGGNWVNGKYAMDAANALTVTTNVFTSYNANANGHIGLEINDDGVEYFAKTSPATTSASYTLPANSLPTNQGSNIEVSFTIVKQETTIAGGAIARAVYGKDLEVEIIIVPKIATQSSSQALAAGSSTTLFVTATGTPGLSYQWKKGGTNLAGQTSPSLAVNNFQAAQADAYTCVVTNEAGTATSAPIVLSLPAADPYASFISSNGLDLATTGAPGFDFDKDGISNLLEFVLNGNPKVANAGILPQVTPPSAANGQKLVIKFTRNVSASTIATVVEHSPNLLPPWITAVHGQDDVTIVTGSPIAGAEEVTVTLPAGEGKRFARLKATR